MSKRTKIKYSKSILLKNFILSFIVVFLLGLSLVNVLVFETQANTVSMNHIDNEIAYWEKLSQEHPSYREAYLKLAELELKKGNMGGVYKNLSEAQKQDPNKFFY